MAQAGPADPALAHRVLEAHGILASVAWAAIMPLGAILIRLIPSGKAWLVHGAVMGVGLAMFTAAFGLGLWDMSQYHSTISKFAHTIIGTVMFAFAWLQPFLSVAHHYIYQRTSKRALISAVHVYFGRLLIITGMINGGIGLATAKQSTRAENIIYGTLVGVIWVVYTLLSLGFEVKRGNKAQWALQRVSSTRSSGSSGSYDHVRGSVGKSEMS
ncbi:Putative cytochrome b561/ferric reductase transmembrane [Septoria linicola]|uniref:Cytochrome b561/ferric reductase transmembrane n=1 Tax=Septoria linicola TaxID=215465 RepID=A0A9Q9AQX1_9PEZI|nr:putative cytochrome b561/ferric reductase transmembrane [Septoria linicola]USW51488.1 Putative cytochrome b561/ferric reductase transmembrane [Septoria linicola]